MRIDANFDAGQGKARFEGWHLLVVGAVLGAALAAVLLGDWTDRPDDSETVSTASTPGAPIPGSADPDDDEATSHTPPPVIAEGQIDGTLLAVTGDWTQSVLERWAPGFDELLGPLPYLGGANLRTDASGRFYAFTASSSDAFGDALYVGQNERYVAFSASASSFAWHASEPGYIAWIQIAGEDRMVMAAYTQIDVIDPDASRISAEPAQLTSVEVDEWLVAFDEWGIVTASYDAVTGQPMARRVGRDGSTEARADGILPLVVSRNGIGLASVGTDGSGLFNHQLVDATFHALADVGQHHDPSLTSAWSPSGDHVALVDYAGEDALDFNLEVWTATGGLELEVPLRHYVSGIAWTADGGSIVLQATDSAQWQGILILDLETMAISRIQVDREAIMAVAPGAT